LSLAERACNSNARARKELRAELRAGLARFSNGSTISNVKSRQGHKRERVRERERERGGEGRGEAYHS